MNKLVEIHKILARMKSLRVHLGYSQEYVAEHSGMTQSAYAYLEGGKRADIAMSVLLRIAQTLKTDVCMLLGCAAGEAPVHTVQEAAEQYRTKLHALDLCNAQLEAAKMRITDLETLIRSKDELITTLRS